jgi:hypothetical protein
VTLNGAALCVGVSKYNDRGLAPLPDAAASAREVQKALDGRIFPATAAIVDPGSNGDLFLRLQKAAGEARGGSFFLYFAGHALRRGGDLLLCTRDTELDGARGCVPWSDVRGMLKREGVVGGLVLLNADQPAGGGRPQLDGGAVGVLGSLRTYDAGGGNASLRGYADAVLAALQRPAAELEPYSSDGALDAAGLHKYLSEKAPAAAAHAKFSMPERPAVLRDFAPPAPFSIRGSHVPSPRASAPAKPAAEAAPAAAAPAPEPPPPAVEPAPASAPAAIEAPPLPEPESARAPEPAPPAEAAPAPAPEVVEAPAPAPKPAPLAARAAEKPPSKVVYAILAAAAVVAAVLYAMLR